MGLRRMPRRPVSPLARILSMLFVIALFGAVMLLALDARMRPYVQTIAMNNAKSIAERAINEAVAAEMRDEGLRYEDMVYFEKDQSGKITGLSTDILKINRLRTSVSERILSDLSSQDLMDISIPLGNILSGELMSGRGPRIPLKLVPLGVVTTDVENLFAAAGINQTRHQIMLRITVNVAILLPVTTAQTQVETSVCLAETVIVGEVPDSVISLSDGSGRLSVGIDSTT